MITKAEEKKERDGKDPSKKLEKTEDAAEKR